MQLMDRTVFFIFCSRCFILFGYNWIKIWLELSIW